jgi:hypothetical protein
MIGGVPVVAIPPLHPPQTYVIQDELGAKSYMASTLFTTADTKPYSLQYQRNTALPRYVASDVNNKIYSFLPKWDANADPVSSPLVEFLINSELAPGSGAFQANAMLATGGGPNQDLFVFSNHALYKMATGNTLQLIAGQKGVSGYLDAQGTAARFQDAGYTGGNPIAEDSQGNVYVLDVGSGTIRKVDTNGNVTTVAGNRSLTPMTSPLTGPVQGDQMRFFLNRYDLVLGENDKTLYVIASNRRGITATPYSVFKVVFK